jgi:hypothetical protein
MATIKDGSLPKSLPKFTWQILTLFAWLISHQPAVLFSQNKPATSNQPAVLLSQNKPARAISHQPNEQATYVLTTSKKLCKVKKRIHLQ